MGAKATTLSLIHIYEHPSEDTRQCPEPERLRHRLVRFGQDKVLADPAAPSSPFIVCGGRPEGRHPRPCLLYTSDQRKVLTGRAEGYHMDRRDFPAVHLRNISQMRHIGKVPFGYGDGRFFNLAGPCLLYTSRTILPIGEYRSAPLEF